MNDENPATNPKWKKLLDVIPDGLIPVVAPILKEWDAGVTQRFQEIHSEYEGLKPFKEFVDRGVDVDYAKNAVFFADALQRNPQEIAERINKQFNLGYLSPEQAEALQQQNQSSDDFDFEDDNGSSLSELMKNPEFKKLYDGMQAIQEQHSQTQQQAEQEAAIAEFNEYVDTLEASITEKNLPFNRNYVVALMSQGISGEDAVNQYHKDLALAGNPVADATEDQTQTNSSDTDAPVVMGGNGVVGSGTPDGSVNFGELSKNDLNASVEQMILQAQQNNQG